MKMHVALLFYNYPVPFSVVLISIFPLITLLYILHKGSIDNVILVTFFFVGNISNIFLIFTFCFVLWENKKSEINGWIEKDLFLLFMEKRPLRELDEATENAKRDDMVWELNQKIEQGYGINHYYSRSTLMDQLNTRIFETSRAGDDVTPARVPNGREGIVLAAKKIMDKDIESNVPPEIIELTNNFDDERGQGENKETM